MLAVSLSGMPLAPIAFADDVALDEGTASDGTLDVDEPIDPSEGDGGEPVDPDSGVVDPSNPGSNDPADVEQPGEGAVDVGSADEAQQDPVPEQTDQGPSSGFVQDEPSDEMSSIFDSPSQPQEKRIREATQSKIEGKMTKAEQIAELLAQVDAIVGQMQQLDFEMATLQMEYDAAQETIDNAQSAVKKKRKRLRKREKELATLRERLSEHVVDMYKRGGVTPYLDALVRTTSYREFLSAWYMLDEVSRFGEDELHEKSEAVATAKSAVEKLEKRIKKAEKAKRNALSEMNRARLMYLSLAPHVARLTLEAAELGKDKATAAAALAEYEAANAALEEALASGLKVDPKLTGGGFFTHPCPGAVYSSGFGYRTFDNSYHLGLDMAIEEGTPYYAADDGVVIDATNGGGYNGGAGNWVVIEHANGVVTKYMHSLVTLVNPGDHVARGQSIGLVGNTGNSFGAHLHFQVEVNGTAIDPAIYL